MATASVKKNYVFNLISEIFIILLPFITVPYTSRVLGADEVGIYAYAVAMMTYFINAAVLGTNTYGQRAVAFYRDDKEKMSEVFWNTFFFRMITTLVSLGVYYIYLVFSHNMNILCIVVSISILDTMFDLAWFFKGTEQFKQITIRTIIVKSIATILIFTLVRTPNDTWIYALIMSMAVITQSISYWPFMRKYVTKPKKIRPFTNIKDIILIFLPAIAIEVYALFDKTMLGWLLPEGVYEYQVGCYDRAEKIVKLPLAVLTSLAAVILSRVANLYNEGKHEETKEVVYKGLNYTWMISIPMTIGFIMISSIFVPLYLGDGYDLAIILLQIVAPLSIFIGLSAMLGQSFLVPTKKQNVYTIAVTSAAVANLVMNLILIPRYAAIGAAISTVVAEAVGMLVQLLYCFFTKRLEPKMVFNKIWKYFIAGGIMFGYCYLIKYLLSGHTITCLLVMIGGAIIIYFAILLLLKDDLVISQVTSIFDKVFKRKNNKENS